MKVVIFGEYKVERMVAPLLEHGCRVVVFAEVPIDDMMPAEVVSHPLDVRWTPSDVRGVLDREAPDVATTSIYAVGQEQLLGVYSEAASTWGGRFVVHPPAFAELACDKVALHQVAQAGGWPVPAGTVCHSGDEAHAAAVELGYPVVLKVARSQAGEGVRYLGSPTALSRVVREVTYPVVVMEFCAGTEIGVELVSGERGLARWPVESAGPLDERLAPLRRPRVSPYPLEDTVAGELDELIAGIVEALRPWGGWQLDLAVVHGHLRLLEINGRLGGLSELGLTTTGVDPHAVAALECLGATLPQPMPERVGLEVTGTAGAVPAPLTDGMNLIEMTWNSTHRSLKGTGKAQYIVGMRHPADGEAWVRAMARRGLRVPVPDALAQLAVGFAALAAVG